jgi:hypothetical protein
VCGTKVQLDLNVTLRQHATLYYSSEYSLMQTLQMNGVVKEEQSSARREWLIDIERLRAAHWPSYTHEYSERDVVLYALGCGCGSGLVRWLCICDAGQWGGSGSSQKHAQSPEMARPPPHPHTPCRVTAEIDQDLVRS